MQVPSRRSVLAAGAWSAPAVVLAGGAPAFATSGPRAVVHTLNLEPEVRLPQRVSHDQAGVFNVSGTQEFLGSMTRVGGAMESFQVANSFTVPGAAAMLYQQRAAITNIAQTYGSRSRYTITVTQVYGPPARNLQLTVGGLNVDLEARTHVTASIDAIRLMSSEAVVVSHGAGLYSVDESGAVPAHYTADILGRFGVMDSRSCITFMRPGSLSSITFEVWNKATGNYQGSMIQNVHLGALQVTSDV